MSEYADATGEDAWLANVPAHWTRCAPKYVMRAASGGNAIKGDCSPEPFEGGFQGFSASGADVWLEKPQFKSSGIVLSAVGAQCGKTFKADGQWGVVANTHCLFPRSNADRDYLWYVTNLPDWWEKGGSAQPFVKVQDTLSRKWAFPPLPEQRAIADFLDRETAKIDSLITKQQELIERIEEHKRAYVFVGVTKGIDPAAPFKASGVAWLGDVPEHWEIRPLKRFVQFHAGAGFPDAEQGLTDEELPFFKVKDLGARGAGEVLTTTDNAISRETAKRLRAHVFPSKSIVMAKIGAALLLNRFRMVGVECCLDNNMLGIECDQRQMEPDFALMLMGAVLDMRMLVNPGAVPSLNETRLGRLMVAAPSLAEQRSIVGHLRATTDELNRLRQAAVRVVDSLQERRSALITAAITGQIEVASGMVAEAAA